MTSTMVGINPKNLRLTNRTFEYEADPSFDLIEGSSYSALKRLIIKKIKERNYHSDVIKDLIINLNFIFHFIEISEIKRNP